MTSAHEARALCDHLRALRSRAGGSLAEMAVATRVSERYLRALESDARDEVLPAPVFVRGFIRAYCAFLGAPADEALALYHRELGIPFTKGTRAVRARPRRGWMGHPLAISSALLLIFGGGLLALKLGTAPPAIPPPTSASMAASAVDHGISLAGRPETQRLVVKAVEPTWIRVQVDGGREVEAVLEAGAQREWTSDRRFVLSAGNAGGIEVVLNGRPLPSLGARGAVIQGLSLPDLPGQGS